MLLKIDTKGMDKEEFYKVIRILSAYSNRGMLSGFNVYNELHCILLFVPNTKNVSIYKIAKGLGVPITVEVVG